MGHAVFGVTAVGISPPRPPTRTYIRHTVHGIQYRYTVYSTRYVLRLRVPQRGIQAKHARWCSADATVMSRKNA